MFEPYFLWWQFFATEYLYLFRQHTHTEHSQVLSSLPSHCARLRQRRIIHVPWAAVPGSSTPTPLCCLHIPGVAEHSQGSNCTSRHTHTHPHTQSTFGLQLGRTRVSLLSSTPISAVQLDTSFMGLSMPSPASWGACNVLSCPLSTYISGEISVPNWHVPPQRPKH